MEQVATPLAEKISALIEEQALTREELIAMLRQMMEIRALENNIAELLGKAVLKGASHLYAGQEAVAVGAISVLIILAIMMTRNFQKGNQPNKMQLPVAIIAAALLGFLIYAVTASPWRISNLAPVENTTAPLATKLFSENGYILPVEIGAVLLLAAIIGAIVITRENKD